MTNTEFIMKLGKAFTFYIDKKLDETTLFSAIQYWFFSLPKYTKVTTNLYLGNNLFKPLDSKIIKLKNFLKNPEIVPDKFIFEVIPSIFEEADLSLLSEKVIVAKEEIDSILPMMLENLKRDICLYFKFDDKNDLGKGLLDWYMSLPEHTKCHCFDDGEERLFKAVLENANDINKLSLDLIGFLPDDFEENTPTAFTRVLLEHKSVIEGYSVTHNDNLENTYEILFEGRPIKTIKKNSENSKVGNLMLNEINTIISEYGYAISLSEKRTILLNVLSSI